MRLWGFRDCPAVKSRRASHLSESDIKPNFTCNFLSARKGSPDKILDCGVHSKISLGVISFKKKKKEKPTTVLLQASCYVWQTPIPAHLKCLRLAADRTCWWNKNFLKTFLGHKQVILLPYPCFLIYQKDHWVKQWSHFPGRRWGSQAILPITDMRAFPQARGWKMLKPGTFLGPTTEVCVRRTISLFARVNYLAISVDTILIHWKNIWDVICKPFPNLMKQFGFSVGLSLPNAMF